MPNPWPMTRRCRTRLVALILLASGLRAQLSPAAGAMARLLGVRGALIHGCLAPAAGGAFPGVSISQCGDVTLSGNDPRLKAGP